MLKDNPQAKKSLIPNLSKPLKIGLAVLAGIILLIVISSLLSGRKSGATQPIVDVLARGQETLRVTALVQSQPPLQDPQTQALAATVNISLSSDHKQLISYLAKNNNKVGVAQLAADINKSTDSAMRSASQNNGLDGAYIAYLKDNLSKYATDLQTAYKAAGPNGKALLQSAYNSTNTLLTSPQLKS